MKISFFFIMLFAVTCTSQKSNLTSNAKNQEHILTYVTGDDYSNMNEPETIIIRDSKRLKKLYSRINRTRKPGLPLPDIDFSRELVIMRCGGTSTGSAITNITVIEVTDTTIVIGSVKSNVDLTSSTVTTPFSLYRLADTTKEIVIRD